MKDKKFFFSKYIFIFLLLFLPSFAISAQNISNYGAIDSSIKSISINSSFKGIEVIIYGICKKLDTKIISVLSGPKKNAIINKKIKKYGLWINNEQAKILNADLVYLVSSNIPIPIIENATSLSSLKLDAKNITYNLEKKYPEEKSKELIRAFKSSRSKINLFTNVPYSFEFIDSSKGFFKITYTVPKSVPEGEYNVKINFLENGIIKNSIETPISIRSDRLYSLIYKIAKKHPILYGIICSSIAMIIGITISNVLKSPVNT